jgi:hypothetical protein
VSRQPAERPPALPGFYTVTEPCPRCGVPWHIGTEYRYRDVLSPTGLTFEGDVLVALLRRTLGACDTCRGWAA